MTISGCERIASCEAATPTRSAGAVVTGCALCFAISLHGAVMHENLCFSHKNYKSEEATPNISCFIVHVYRSISRVYWCDLLFAMINGSRLVQESFLTFSGVSHKAKRQSQTL